MFQRPHPVQSLLMSFLTVICCANLDAKERKGATDVYRKSLRGTALIVNRAATGTGWLVDSKTKLLVTNYHVVAEKYRPEKTSPQTYRASKEVLVVFPVYLNDKPITERKFYRDNLSRLGIRGRVVAADEWRDLALVRLDTIPKGAKALAISTEKPAPGTRVHSIGNPSTSGALWVYSQGQVRSVYPKSLRTEFGPHKFQAVETQSPINAGDSGGPVVDDRGNVVAIAQSVTIHANLVTTCIGVEELRSVLRGYRSAKSPITVNAYYLRARSLHRLGRYAEAIRNYDKAIKLDARYVVAYLERGRAFNATKQYQRAIKDFNKAIVLDPKDKNIAITYANRGEAYGWLKQWTRSIADSTKALDLGYREPVVYGNRALAYENTKQYSQAIRDYTKMVQLEPNKAEHFYLRAGAWNAWAVDTHKSGRRSIARGYWTKALADFEASSRLGLRNAQWLKICQKQIKAIRDYLR